MFGTSVIVTPYERPTAVCDDIDPYRTKSLGTIAHFFNYAFFTSMRCGSTTLQTAITASHEHIHSPR
jgi:hypothetical protein